MRKAAGILALVFGIAFLGMTYTNARLVGEARAALAGSGAAPAPRTARYHLVAILPDTDDSFFGDLLRGIEEGAAAIDAAVQVFRYGSSMPQEAERYFEIALRSKVDGVVMYARREDKIRGKEARAAAAGVAYVPVGTDAPSDSPAFFIGSGSFRQGEEGGKLIGAALGAGAKVGMILPATGSGRVQDEPLYRGAASALKAYPGARIVAVARAQAGLFSGEAVAEAMLRSEPRPNALLCSTARDTVGVAQVLIDQNQVGRILVVGADETPEVIRYLDKGVVAASIVRDSRKMGGEAVRAFLTQRLGDGRAATTETDVLIRGSRGSRGSSGGAP
ncbi:MAG: substrate-binding domain-containing protein [Spirochaetaceae bacterium]|nr:substrate-binding domain-containing protein [Spirochaetaceae bacterium]